MTSPAGALSLKASDVQSVARRMIVVSFVPHPSAIRACSSWSDNGGRGRDVFRNSPREAQRSKRAETSSLWSHILPVWKWGLMGSRTGCIRFDNVQSPARARRAAPRSTAILGVVMYGGKWIRRDRLVVLYLLHQRELFWFRPTLDPTQLPDHRPPGHVSWVRWLEVCNHPYVISRCRSV